MSQPWLCSVPSKDPNQMGGSKIYLTADLAWTSASESKVRIPTTEYLD